MKFSCDSCGRKYRIEDEKVQGKTLRMDCRKCGKKILIDGKALRATTSDRPPTARPPAASSPLSKGFYDQVSRPQADVGGGLAAREPKQWHLEINNVAVGPIGRSEVARKIETGAVKASSLCWREGFDDWRPLHTVSELASLLQPAKPPSAKAVPLRHTPPPPPPRSPNRVGNARSAPAAIGGRAGASAAVAMAPAPFSAPERESQPEPKPFSPVPAPTPAPIASLPPLVSDPPEQTGSSTSLSGSEPGLIGSEPGSLGREPGDRWTDPVPDGGRTIADSSYSSIPAAFGKKKGAPLMLYLAMGAGGLFLMAIGIFIGVKYLASPTQSAGVPEAAKDPVPSEEQKAPDIVIPVEDTIDEPLEEEVSEETTAKTGAKTTRRTSSPKTGTPKPNEPQLTEEERRRLERMGGASGIKLNTGGSGSGGSSGGGSSLTESQLRTVVQRNYRDIQSCYERAVRGMGNVPAFRLSADISISGSGRVTSIKLGGKDINGLKSCIAGEAKRWVFPKTGATTNTAIPFVFQETG